MKILKDVRDHGGLAAYSVTMTPDTNAYVPDPARGDAQCVPVLETLADFRGAFRNRTDQW